MEQCPWDTVLSIGRRWLLHAQLFGGELAGWKPFQLLSFLNLNEETQWPQKHLTLTACIKISKELSHPVQCETIPTQAWMTVLIIPKKNTKQMPGPRVSCPKEHRARCGSGTYTSGFLLSPQALHSIRHMTTITPGRQEQRQGESSEARCRREALNTATFSVVTKEHGVKLSEPQAKHRNIPKALSLNC